MDNRRVLFGIVLFLLKTEVIDKASQPAFGCRNQELWHSQKHVLKYYSQYITVSTSFDKGDGDEAF
jgi:hypothetical protein